MNIEIITAPNETLKETGFGSLNTCQNVLSSIQKMGHNGRIVSCESLADLERVIKRKPDLVLLAVKYIPMEKGDNIWLSEYFENHAIAYSGSSKDILQFDSDKILAKLHLREKNISTAAFFTASVGQFQRDEALPLNYPLFLKPNGAANGNGIDEASFVQSFEEFESKTLSLQKSYGQPILAEELLTGKEYTVAMITTQSGELLDAAIEIVPPKSNRDLRILSGNIKTKNIEVLKIISDIKVRNKVRKIASEVFIGLGIEGFARIDIKSNADGRCFFMEVNLVPGMTAGSSYFPEACRMDRGLSYDQTVAHMVNYCLGKELKAMQRTHLFSYHQGDLALT
ncbi:D-alanine--D-alanine ligase [Agaribacterium sp. ZY112]|uniref:D-alanine--D-alanine ligase n=1 Tax=Agaribacterium sp. ZY112 TaxID=3233574 RepID=UPI0035247BC9